jgi:hypothetical protein
MELIRGDHGVVYTDRVVSGFMYGIGEKIPWLSVLYR